MRIQSIDILRGIAILGILFMNIYFHGSLTTGYGELSPKPIMDSVIETLNTIFFDGRFRTLFCLFFGAGLAIQYSACKKKQLSPKDFLTSRLNWLIVFGIIHGVFIFGGDVLLLYSVCALTILSALELTLKELYNKAIRYISIGIILSLTLAVLVILFSEDSSMLRSSNDYIEMHELWFSHYGYQVLIQSGITFGLLLLSPLFIYWQIAGLMLLGAFLYRVGFFTKGFRPKQLTGIIFVALIFICIDISCMTMFTISAEMSSVLSSVSAIFVALLYAHVVIRLIKNKGRFITLFSAPGKIAFSLYIFQSIFMGLLLRWWQQDFHLTAHRIDYVMIALAFTFVQIALAHLYLHFFKQGPLEYIWRKAYQRSLTQKKEKLGTNSALY
ncbi:DUF418 domain-containing protein [Colwellia psychrerythraea]|uniref:DUF418 domain-containing protein n=1 Tax=Colwellia psychrerythraea TaxID=28229 RepID=A0A099KS01_COLPS|nr:DUF418 domain-containing protein [Colwellia psychrerythraea]KGJ92990.1 protein of unknown function DUF418 [Colwellia psychrerythraea]